MSLSKFTKTAMLLLISLTFVQITFAQNSLSDLLKNLSDEHQFLKMDSLNENTRNKDYYFYKALFANVCNKPQTSNLYLDSLKNNPVTATLEYAKLKYDNYIKLFNYEMAYRTSQILTTKFKGSFSEKDLADEINEGCIWKALRKEPTQVIENFTQIIIPAKKDKAGLRTILIKQDNFTTDFVFDTGAGISCMAESMARKFGVSLMPDNNVSIESFTGQKNKVRIGIAPKLTIGSLKIHNTVFLIYPDSAFTFADGAYVINGIIGFPIAKELGTVTITKDQLTFSKTTANYGGQKNLFVDELRAIVMLGFKGKRLPFNFDSGANTSLFTKAFYEEFKSYIDLYGVIKEDKSSGAGAQEIRKEVVELQNQEIYLGTNQIKLEKMTIDKNDYGIYGKVNFGNIGQDIISQFEKVVISFDNNFLQLQH